MDWEEEAEDSGGARTVLAPVAGLLERIGCEALILVGRPCWRRVGLGGLLCL